MDSGPKNTGDTSWINLPLRTERNNIIKYLRQLNETTDPERKARLKNMIDKSREEIERLQKLKE